MSPETSAPPARLSIVIPAKDRAPELEATLTALRQVAPAGCEIVVVDDGSRDATAEVARRHGCRVVRHEVNRGAAAARNAGAREATAPLLLFIDSDVLVPAGLVEEVLRAFDDPGTQALSGLLAPDSLHGNFASQYDALYMHYQYWTHPPDFHVFYTSCAAIRRDLFLAHGGFDENYKGAGIEDMEFGQRLRRAGVPLRLHKSLQVAHAHPFGLAELLFKNRRTAAGTLKIMLRNRGRKEKSARMVAPRWGFLAGIPLTGLAALLFVVSPWWPPAALAALALVAVVVVLNRRFLGFLLARRGPAFTTAGTAFLLVNNLFYGAGIAAAPVSFLAGSRY
jgi:glycosyltransferase involved in cell wall biosynthesis